MSKYLSHALVMAVACFVVAGNLWADDAAADKRNAAQEKRKAAHEKMAKMAQEQFKKLDKDADGDLTLDEFNTFGAKRGGAKLGETLFKLLDKNENGKVCIVEFTKKPPEFRFTLMDKDGDDTLTFDEFKGRREKPEGIERAEQNFKRIDKDGDKKLSLEEFKAAQKRTAKKPAGKKGQKKGHPKRQKKQQQQ